MKFVDDDDDDDDSSVYYSVFTADTLLYAVTLTFDL